MAPAKVLFVTSQSLAFLLGLIGIATAYISLYTDFNDFSDFVPVELVQGTGLISAAVTFVAAMGLLMVVCKVDAFFSLFVLISIIQLVFNIGFFVTLVLFSRGQETLPLLDSLLNDTIVNFESNALEIALEDPEGFVTVQNLLSCCGIDMATRFDLNNSEQLLDVFSGERCVEEVDLGDNVITTGIIEMESIMADSEIEIEDAITAAGDNPVLNNNFFCANDLENLTEEALTAVTGLLGVVIVFEAMSLFCSILIFCCVSRDEEGNLDFEGAERMNRVIVKVTKGAGEPFISGYARFNSFSDRSLGKRADALSLGKLSLDGEEGGKKGDELDRNARSSYLNGDSSEQRDSGVLGIVAPFGNSGDIKSDRSRNRGNDDSDIF